MKIKLLFNWCDFRIGLFYDKQKSWLYVMPAPMITFILKLPQRRYWLISVNSPYEVIGSTIKSELDYCKKQDKCISSMYWAKNGESTPLVGKNYNEQ